MFEDTAVFTVSREVEGRSAHDAQLVVIDRCDQFQAGRGLEVFVDDVQHLFDLSFIGDVGK